MVCIKILIITFLAALSAAIPQSPASIFARGQCDTNYQGGVYVCSNPGFTGKCDYVDLMTKNEFGGCKRLPNTRIASFGPSAGLTCWAWTDQHCGQSLTFQGFPSEVLKDLQCPGHSDLFLTGFNNRLLSFRCDKT
ncbi:hypothetical protein FKW77_009897 [Venturia effusa]|uniref:Cyanovirin-N domain-containing protein n=1 Tax=Venturia effusa TaxID=50376 RepID=A0A517LER7_9PEZI|nr:hypothetical protein FKW77_009897 [Venturia effusa]